MRGRLAVTAGLTALATLTTMTSPAQAGHRHDDLRRQIDAVVAAGATSATVEVAEGKHVRHATSGVAEIGSNRPVPANARFRAGSETKTFLATIVLQLVAEGRIKLDDTVESRLPGVVPDGDRITIRQLLNHTSGLYEVLRTLPSPRSEEFLAIRFKTWTTEELVARATAYPLVFEPGKQVQYNNTGYLVLALIVKRVTGHSAADEIERRIIRPLHLSDTTEPGTDPRIHGPHAHGYLPLDTGLFDITEVNPSIMNAAGDLISSTRDLNRFFTALLGGRLLPDGLLREMKQTALGSQYGLGIIRRDPCGEAWGKDGDAPGYSAWTFVSPDRRRTVSVSVTWGAGDPGDAVDALLDDQLCR